MSSRQSPANYQNYTWVNGFQDFFAFIKENVLFTVGFSTFMTFIAYTLIASFDKRMEPFLKEKCFQIANNNTHYFNGHSMLSRPEGDLVSVYKQVIDKVRLHKTLLLEDLAELAKNATLEQAEAAIQINGEFIIHPYRVVVSCKKEIKPNDGLLTVALVYVIAFAIFIIYMTSPFGKNN